MLRVYADEQSLILTIKLSSSRLTQMTLSLPNGSLLLKKAMELLLLIETGCVCCDYNESRVKVWGDGCDLFTPPPDLEMSNGCR